MKELQLEETLVAALETVDGLAGRVCPLRDIQKSSGPLAVFEQIGESEEKAIDGLTGMAAAVYKIHVLHGTYEKMRLLAERIKRTIQALWQYAEGSLYIEEVSITMASPDIYEDRVQLFRRTYNVTIQYQIEEEI